jgi:diguanylate cyclase (GGDEF)-like protein
MTPHPPKTPDMESAERAMSRGAFWLMLRRVAVFAGCVDLVYLVVFFVLGMPVMALVNLVSAGMYAAAYALLGRRRNLPAVLLMWTEVLVHACACTILLGWDTGIHYFLLVFLPAVAVSRSPRLAAAAMGFVLAAYLALDAATQAIPAAYHLTAAQTTALRWLSITVVFLMFGYTARYYVRRVQDAERRLAELATTDPLCGLWNRRFFLQRAQAEVERARRYGSRLALVMADIDHFKLVNDRNGHAVGDQVIRHVAGLMHGELRASDIIGRWGGEEFVLLLQTTDAAEAAAVCERLRTAVERTPCESGAATVRATLSLGVAEVDPGQGLEHAIRRADAALYAAKHAGRNRVCSAEPVARHPSKTQAPMSQPV